MKLNFRHLSQALRAAKSLPLLFVCLFLSVTPALAGMIYTTFGANFTASNDGYAVGWGGLNFTPSMLFTSYVTTSVSQIDLALNGTDAATVALYTDSNNSPGALLQSWAVQPVAATAAYPNPIVSITNISGLTINAGESYFLLASVSSNTTSDDWQLNTQNISGYVYDPPYSGSGKALAAFDLQYGVATSPPSAPAPSTSTTSVPAPAVTLLLGLSVLGLLFASRRKSFTV